MLFSKRYNLFIARIVVVICYVSFTYAARPYTIPALQEWTDGSGSYTFSGNGEIVVNSAGFNNLKSTAVTFTEDIFLLTKEEGAACTLSVRGAASCNAGDIFLTIDSTDTTIGPRGYILEISDFITIKALTDLGIFWGTRSVLQLLRQGYTLNKGTARDWPTFIERGLHTDFGRKYFTVPWIHKHMRDLSYLKFNIFHFHLADNFGFRLDSKLHPEIVADDYYTDEEIEEMNQLADKYHITIIPEIDMPGHMTAMLENHPEIAVPNNSGDLYADLGEDSAYRFMEEVFDEQIPKFTGPYWHIGNDEYWGNYDSNKFLTYARQQYGSNATAKDCIYGYANWANEIVRSHGKAARSWKDGLVNTAAITIDTNIVVEHWYEAYGDPGQTMVNRGHYLINCHYTRLYYVYGWGSGSPNSADVYENLKPHNLQGTDLSNAHEPQLLGAKMHIWCDDPDYETEDVTTNNIFDKLRAVSQMCWESPKLVTSFTNFTPIIEDIDRAPGFTDVLPDIPQIEVIDPVTIDYIKPVKTAGVKQWVIDFSKSSVSMHYNGKHTITLLTVQGKCLASFSGFGKESYNLSGNTAPGIYLLKIVTDKESVVKLPVLAK